MPELEEVDESLEGQTSESTEQESNEGQTQDRKMNEEDLVRLGLSETFLGKPYHETLESQIKEKDKWNRQLSMKLVEFEKKLGEFDLTPKQINTVKENVKENVDDKLPEMPDPLDDPEAFRVWLEKRDELTRKEFRKELDQLKNQKNPEVDNLIAERNNSLLYENIGKGLKATYGENFDEKLIDTASKEYDTYFEGLPESKQQALKNLYNNDPDGLAEAVVTFHKAQNFGKKPDDDKNKQHEKEVNKLKNTGKKFTNSASSQRDKVEIEDDSPYKKLIAEGEMRLKGEKQKSGD